MLADLNIYKIRVRADGARGAARFRCSCRRDRQSLSRDSRRFVRGCCNLSGLPGSFSECDPCEVGTGECLVCEEESLEESGEFAMSHPASVARVLFHACMKIEGGFAPCGRRLSISRMSSSTPSSRHCAILIAGDNLACRAINCHPRFSHECAANRFAEALDQP